MNLEVENYNQFNLFEISKVYYYTQDGLELLAGQDKPEFSLSFLKEFIEQAIAEDSYNRKVLINKTEERAYELHAVPNGVQAGSLIIANITKLLTFSDKLFTVYKQVIEAVTGGKLKLIDRLQAVGELKVGTRILTFCFNNKEEIKEIRSLVKKYIQNFELTTNQRLNLLLSVSEAVTNAFKHAGGGRFELRELGEQTLRFIVADNGPGIELEDLPKAALMDSYSDFYSFSLGKGFPLLLRFNDLVLLKTDDQGTTVILELTLFENS